MGKGSRPRPLSIEKKNFDKKWDNIFKKTPNESNYTSDKRPTKLGH